MQKEFVTYKIALKLKELGFDEPCFAIFDHNSEELYFEHNEEIKAPFDYSENSLKGTSYIIAALYQQVTDWFREKHNIQIEILWRGDMDTFNYKIGTFQYGTYIFSDKDWKFEEYYEAREQAILKVIELCQKEK